MRGSERPAIFLTPNQLITSKSEAVACFSYSWPGALSSKTQQPMLLETQRAQEDNRLNVKAALPSLPTPSLIMLLLLLDCCGQICQPGDPEEEAGALSPRVSIRSITSMTEVKNAMFSTPKCTSQLAQGKTRSIRHHHSSLGRS